MSDISLTWGPVSSMDIYSLYINFPETVSSGFVFFEVFYKSFKQFFEYQSETFSCGIARLPSDGLCRTRVHCGAPVTK